MANNHIFLLVLALHALSVAADDDIDDSPPQKVLRNAITTSNASDSITLTTDFPSVEVPIYANLYFSEVTELGSTQKRAFRVYKGNESLTDIIIPTYGTASEVFIGNITASSGTIFNFVATPDSTLPPLINALELFYISNALTDGTSSDDVAGLVLLQNQFEVLKEWMGDPCLPAPYSWDWINCSTDATPRVTALNLSSFNLSGPLPDFSSMDALVTIDLHNNSLNGSVPDFLGTLPKLKQLNLASNQFSGSIPASLTNNNNLNLMMTGNPNLCTSDKSCPTTDTPISSGNPVTPSGRKKTGNHLPVILDIIIPSFFVFWAIVGVLAIIRHNKRKAAAVDAIGAGQNGGANKPNGKPHVVNYININIEPQGNVELSDQMDPRMQYQEADLYDPRTT